MARPATLEDIPVGALRTMISKSYDANMLPVRAQVRRKMSQVSKAVLLAYWESDDPEHENNMMMNLRRLKDVAKTIDSLLETVALELSV